MNKEKSFKISLWSSKSGVRQQHRASRVSSLSVSHRPMKTFLEPLFVIKINCFQDYKCCLNVCEFAHSCIQKKLAAIKRELFALISRRISRRISRTSDSEVLRACRAPLVSCTSDHSVTGFSQWISVTECDRSASEWPDIVTGRLAVTTASGKFKMDSEIRAATMCQIVFAWGLQSKFQV